MKTKRPACECSKCGIQKKPEDFHRNKSYCKTCAHIMRADYYARTKAAGRAT